MEGEVERDDSWGIAAVDELPSPRYEGSNKENTFHLPREYLKGLIWNEHQRSGSCVSRPGAETCEDVCPRSMAGSVSNPLQWTH